MEIKDQIIDKACYLLRKVATGGSTNSDYFWLTLLALEAVRDNNVQQYESFFRTLQKVSEQ